MEAGRELDALIAEHVMGMDVDELGFHGGPKNYLGMAPPPYSTDISAAWEVAQKIADMDDDNDFVIHLSPSKFEECEVEIKFWDRSDPNDPVLAGPFYILGDTAPHAICLAALKAVGFEPSQT